MTNVQAPCETDQTWLTTPIIQINGERLDEGGTTEWYDLSTLLNGL
jgi:hypothetical protein